MAIDRNKLIAICILIALVGVGWVYQTATAPKSIPASIQDIDPSLEPRQIAVHDPTPFKFKLSDGRLLIEPKASYRVTAKIGGRESYYFGWQSQLVKYDFVLMWGRLATEDLSDFLRISQSGRWYHWRLKDSAPVDVGYVSSHSANTHIIPATDNLKRALSRLDSGDVVQMDGYLVFVKGLYKGGEVWWNSSLSRTDTGDGACEVFYITSLVSDGRQYQ